jgi:hypothetical protein
MVVISLVVISVVVISVVVISMVLISGINSYGFNGPNLFSAFIQSNLARANTMMEEGGDWDRRNRLKVYEGLYSMSVRNFGKAAELFLETVSTFTSYELMDYKQASGIFSLKKLPFVDL